MAYDETKDITLKEIKIYDGEYVVRLVQYDGGQKKIAIMKKISSKHGEIYSAKSLGRVDLETGKQIAKSIAIILKEEK